MSRFICIEGIDYAGKTSLVNWLCGNGFIMANRVAEGYENLHRQMELNGDINTRLDFYLGELRERSENYRALSTDFVADRYFLSVIAYHNVLMNRELHIVEKHKFNALLKPHVTILLTVDKAGLEYRSRNRSPGRWEEDIDFLLAVQNEFIRLSGFYENIVVMNTSHCATDETGSNVLSIINESAPTLNHL
jgi:thymidylate kinase